MCESSICKYNSRSNHVSILGKGDDGGTCPPYDLVKFAIFCCFHPLFENFSPMSPHVSRRIGSNGCNLYIVVIGPVYSYYNLYTVQKPGDRSNMRLCIYGLCHLEIGRCHCRKLVLPQEGYSAQLYEVLL